MLCFRTAACLREYGITHWRQFELTHGNTMPLLDHHLFMHRRRIMTLCCGADLAV
jgi:hypothetical protein